MLNLHRDKKKCRKEQPGKYGKIVSDHRKHDNVAVGGKGDLER